MMKTLWAPWRMEYILSEKPKECIFCTKPLENHDRTNLILFRGSLCFVIMNKYPYNNGHLMVVPYMHTPSMTDLSKEQLHALIETTDFALDCIKEAFHPEGFNIGINIGVAAGAGIEEHLHLHIVPRWGGDSNFMAAIGEVRVIPEHIMDTYDKLYGVFNKPNEQSTVEGQQ